MEEDFDVCVYLHFISILISYILAASESWGLVFGVEVNCKSEPSHEAENNLRLVILGFGVIFTTAIMAGQSVFTSVVSAMTAIKGTLLVLMVAVTAYIAFTLDQTIINDYSYLADSFLMSTVALGGAVNVMPLIFAKVKQTRNNVRKFRIALVSGLVVCGMLIVLWTYFVMKAVPQTDPSDENPSLLGAAENGCISTIPLTEIIDQQTPNLAWIANIVEGFIIISVTISFITVGSGMKNFIDGYISSFIKKNPVTLFRNLPTWLPPSIIYKSLAYFISFGISLAVALGKPACFLVIMEYFTSMALNLENGAFIAYMVLVSSKYKIAKIPLPLPKFWMTKLTFAVAAFFLLTVVYDLCLFIYNMVQTGGNLC